MADFITLYISDLDGTLLNSKCALSDRTVEILNRQIDKGVMFTFATARSLVSAGPLTERLNLKLPAVIFNGVFLANPVTKEYSQKNYLSAEEMTYLKQVVTAENISPFIYTHKDGAETVRWLVGSETKGMLSYIKNRPHDKRLHPCNSMDDVFTGDIFYATFITSTLPPEHLNSLFDCRFSTNYQADSYNKEEFWYELFKSGVTKGGAVLRLKEMLGADRLVCFGDNFNDIPMLIAADCGCAVDNAYDEVKKAADTVIWDNNNDAVAVYIEQQETPVWRYDRKANAVDDMRFAEAVEKARAENLQKGIGVLSEKLIHRTLKYYFEPYESNHELKIGRYFADIVGENGIIEIQTSAFDRLNKKLGDFLESCHVTVVYPVKAAKRIIYTDKTTGEVIKKGAKVKSRRDFNEFFYELYRIRTYLTNPNLSFCIAELEIEEYRYTDGETMRKRNGQKSVKAPVKLLSKTYLHSHKDFVRYIPKDLPETFTKKELTALVKKDGIDGSMLLGILTYTGNVKYTGKRGNEFLYRCCQPVELSDSETIID